MKSSKNFFKKDRYFERSKEFSESSDLLKKVAKFLGLDDEYFVIMSKWEQEIGNKKIILNGFKAETGTVLAQTSSAVYLNDLNLRKRQIINRLNQYLGSNKIKNIKCEIR